MELVHTDMYQALLNIESAARLHQQTHSVEYTELAAALAQLDTVRERHRQAGG
jgi:hypothetical protein